MMGAKVAWSLRMRSLAVAIAIKNSYPGLFIGRADNTISRNEIINVIRSPYELLAGEDSMTQLKIRKNKDIASRIEGITNRITKINVSDYPIWVMERMIHDLEHQRQNILEELESLEQQVEKEFTIGDIDAVETIKTQVSKLKKRDQELEEEFQRLFNYRQTNILKERITVRLGGKFGYQLKEILITVLVIFVLTLMIYENLNPDLSDEMLKLFFWIDASCCLIFLIDFFFELSLADSKGWYWKMHFIDFITSIPVHQARTLRIFRGMRVIRLLRLARFLRFLRFLRLLRVLLFFWRGLDHLVQMFNVRLMKKSLIYVCISLIVGAVAFQFFEGAEAALDKESVVTSLWWSFTTVVTGGFADIHDPVTMGGKILTVVLVIVGMVIVSIFTATLTTVMVGEEDDIEQLKSEMNEQFSQLLSRVENIERSMNLLENFEEGIRNRE